MTQIKYENIKAYLICPLLYYNFNSDVSESQPIRLRTKIIRRIIMYMFFREMELGYPPAFGSLSVIIGKARKELVKELNWNRIRLNNFFMLIKKYYLDQYVGEYAEKGYRPIGFNFPVTYQVGGLYYNDTIPIVFTTPQKTIMPMFFSWEVDDIARENQIRFTSAVLQHKLNIEIKQYMILYFSETSNGVLSLLNYKFSKGEMERALNELRNIMIRMDSGAKISNTYHCSNCKYIRSCKL
jgi:hypothetical protein